MGMKRVKENGGICIVQDPKEAEYSEMPLNSIATGLVDYVLPVAQIPRKIFGYKYHLGTVKIPTEPQEPQELDEVALREIFTLLRVRTGHDFTNYKRSTVLRRIERRVSVHELAGLPAYAAYLREQADEPEALLKDLLISVTNFFRDSHPFEGLEQHIIPKLFENKHGNDHVRVWVAGCATGEEAYSMAMLLSEYVTDPSDAPNVQIFATDIDESAISKAREGLYTLNDAADVSPERLSRFFVKEADGYRVRRELREMVLFATHNIITDPPFSHLDLITCRNLLIYLNRWAQKRIMEVLHFALNPGGHLFLGTSESIEGANDLFSSVDKEGHIFQSRPVEVRLPFPIRYRPPVTQGERSGTEDQTHVARIQERLSYLDIHQRLLEKYAPPSAVINEEYNVLHLSERAGRYMQVAGGEPSHNLLKMVRPELRLELRTALYQAMRSRTNVEARGLWVQLDNEIERVNLIVRPVLHEDDSAKGFILVLFEQDRGDKGSDARPVDAVAASDEPIARRLEEELTRVTAQLRSTIEQQELQHEELKASNEELQAMNEELHSTLEELETGKEELQSVNEELTTVNQELKVKIEELSQANNDFQNLMNSTEIGTIFLDRSLRVKLFTPLASRIFNLIPSDVGRPLSDISSKLIDAELLSIIEQVLESQQTSEQEVETRDGRWYMMRTLPYRTTEDRISGVVLTFVEITQRKQTEEALRRSEERLRLLVASIEDYAIFSTDPEGRVESWNAGAERAFGYNEKEILGRHMKIIFTPEDRANGAAEEELRVARETGRAAGERWHIRKDGSRFYASGVLTQMSGGSMKGYVKVARDLTEQKQAALELELAHCKLETRVEERTLELEQRNEALKSEVSERQRSDELRVQLLRQLVSAQENERGRIARDLHDELGQQLTALRLKLETLKNNFGRDKKSAVQFEQTQAIAQEIEFDLDFLAWNLRPAALDDIGLDGSLTDYVRNWTAHFGIPVEVHVNGFDGPRLTPEIETNLYRIAQEALNNVFKHGEATRVDVILERRDRNVMLIIEDDGVGFDPESKANNGRGMGLIGMRERAALIGGTVEIESAPNEGTTLYVRVPALLVEEGES
jgi:two-component system CheB/CheR fusion protein